MSKLIYPDLSYAIVGAAMEVHRELGPGFHEAIYQAAMERELSLRQIPFTSQFLVSVNYKGASIADYFLD